MVQLGARRHYAIPTFLHQARYLDRFHTDLCASAWWLRGIGAIVPRTFQPAGLRRLLARAPGGVPHRRIRCFSTFAIARVLRRDRTNTPAQLMQAQLRSNRQFCNLVAKHGLGEADVLYVFNGAGLELLQHATRRGMLRIVEQTSAATAFDQRLLAEERERWPGWETQAMTEADWSDFAAREREEWALADAILCGSQHVIDSIAAEGGPVDRCRLVEYGVNARMFSSPPRAPHRRPLRVLCVGAMQLRKGIPYLLQAARELRKDGIVCRVVGDNQFSPAIERELRDGLELAGNVPRSEMPQQYAWADVMVLPSISEGSANVCYEALASGLPVITTANAGSVVRDGVEGFLVPIRSSEGIVKAVSRLDQDRNLLTELSAAAICRAREFTWEQYSRRLIAVLESIVGQHDTGQHAGDAVGTSAVERVR